MTVWLDASGLSGRNDLEGGEGSRTEATQPSRTFPTRTWRDLWEILRLFLYGMSRYRLWIPTRSHENGN